MKVLLPFYDDSTLFFVSRMIDELEKRNIVCESCYLKNGREFDRISKRQMDQLLPDGADYTSDSDELDRTYIGEFSAVIVCKVTNEVKDIVDDKKYMASKERPCFVAFQPGLEFTPEKGIRNRKNFDLVFLNNFDDLSENGSFLYRTDRECLVAWGHPYFVKPKSYSNDRGGNIYFFAQAISPKTFNGRMHVAEALLAIATANPGRKLVVKLRNLPSENTNHVHRELHDYVTLFKDNLNVPKNIEFSACPLKEALDDASLVITCTSTAAMDAISAGIPTMVYTDFVENYCDPMVSAMDRILSESGIITPLESLLHLIAKKPRSAWVERNFRDETLYEELLEKIEKFHG